MALSSKECPAYMLWDLYLGQTQRVCRCHIVVCEWWFSC